MVKLFCGYCHSEKHSQKNCPHTWGGPSNRAKLFCSFCWSKKHNEKACDKKWHGSFHRETRTEELKDDFVLD